VNPLSRARMIYVAVLACLVVAFLGAYVQLASLPLGMSDGDPG
jgi:hypothetical protein